MPWGYYPIIIKLILSACSIYASFYVLTSIRYPLFHIRHVSLDLYRGKPAFWFQTTNSWSCRKWSAYCALLVGVGCIGYYASGAIFNFIPQSIQLQGEDERNFSLQNIVQTISAVCVTVAILDHTLRLPKTSVWARSEQAAREKIVQWLRTLPPETRRDFVEEMLPTMKTWNPYLLPAENIIADETNRLLTVCCNQIDERTAIEVWNSNYHAGFRKPDDAAESERRR
jgi:hypothetical protein